MEEAQSEAKNNEQEGEDSMEEILHSIRDIIANEGEGGGAEMSGEEKQEAPVEESPPTEEPVAETAPAEEDVLELTDVVEETPEEVTAEETPEEVTAEETFVEGIGEDVLDNIDAALGEEAPAPPEEAPAPTEEEPAAAEETPAPAPTDSGSLVSGESAGQAAAEMKKLIDNIPPTSASVESVPLRSGNTVEDLVVESIRPMLSDWLNKNLPTIVKEAVEKEIRKLVPRD